MNETQDKDSRRRRGEIFISNSFDTINHSIIIHRVSIHMPLVTI